jgi:hypothetical protein
LSNRTPNALASTGLNRCLRASRVSSDSPRSSSCTTRTSPSSFREASTTLGRNRLAILAARLIAATASSGVPSAGAYSRTTTSRSVWTSSAR